jgi:two-component system, NarL family, response regulator NreC
VRILIADDHRLVREGLRKILATQTHWEIVGEASDAGEAVTMAGELRPDIILMDISMPGLPTFDAAKQIRKERPETRVLFCSMYDDDGYIRQSMEAGHGLVLKSSGGSELTSAVAQVGSGSNYLPGHLLSRLVGVYKEGRGKPDTQPRLTRREGQLIKLLAEGNTVKEIANGLNLSVKTVEAHKFNLMRKLGIHSTPHLVRYAIEHKIIRVNESLEA